MSFSTELDKALAELYFTAYVEGRNETPDNEDKQDEYEKIHTKPVKAAIIELVKKEVIGEDEQGAQYDGGEMIDCDACGYCVYDEAPHCACDVQNKLRAEQRKKLEAILEKEA